MYSLGSIIEYLKSGELIAYPTEGVWGLGCDPNNLEAVKKVT
jgi:L-threonylcarbamoyladenylate synthase